MYKNKHYTADRADDMRRYKESVTIGDDYPKYVFPNGLPDPYISYVKCPKCGVYLGYYIVNPSLWERWAGCFDKVWAFCRGPCRVKGELVMWAGAYKDDKDVVRVVNQLKDNIIKYSEQIEMIIDAGEVCF